MSLKYEPALEPLRISVGFTCERLYHGFKLGSECNVRQGSDHRLRDVLVRYIQCVYALYNYMHC